MKPQHQMLRKWIIIITSFMLPVYSSQCQICENQALAFLGADLANHHVSCNLVTPINTNFTIEAWFYTTNSSANHWSLFSLSGPGQHSFELSYSNSALFFYWDNGTNPLGGFPISISTTNYTNGWHHIAVSSNGQLVRFFVDGSQLGYFYNYPTTTGALNFTQFFAGHTTASLSFDWHGQMDEIRLWNYARTVGDIQATKDCTLQGTDPSLKINWPLNQGNTPDGPNTGFVTQTTMAIDMSGNNNLGTLIGFDLPNYNPSSNWVCNNCPPIYNIEITDRPSLFPNSLTSICSGDAAHFCVTENGQPINGSNNTIQWEYSDDLGVNWLQLVTPASLFCYQNPSIDVTNECQNSSTGSINRRYRAIVTKTNGTLVCKFTTAETDLQIFCPISGIQIGFTVNSPTQYNYSICEGPADISFSLNNLPDFLNPIVAPGANISWVINSIPQSGCQDMSMCHYTGTAVFPNFPVQVTIQNGPCPPQIINLNIPVDHVPICGSIDQMSGLTLIAPAKYEICPGQDAILGMIGSFQNCNPVWQYHFDTDPPGAPNWQNLGGSNPIQLTNILPQYSPPNNPLSPYLWPVPPSVPVKANTITYRIVCTSPSLPASGCPPCTSNQISLCLKAEPPAPVITGIPYYCFNGSPSTLSITPVPGALNYTWFCNGLFFASGPSMYSIPASMTACYWVEADDGCYKVTSQKFCVEECIVTPIIECPQDNPCACDGMPITLNGCDSFDTCTGTGPLTYAWYANGIFVGNGCQLVHTPNPTGTTYKLVVTNAIGCMRMTTKYIKPCI